LTTLSRIFIPFSGEGGPDLLAVAPQHAAAARARRHPLEIFRHRFEFLYEHSAHYPRASRVGVLRQKVPVAAVHFRDKLRELAAAPGKVPRRVPEPSVSRRA
jgi:hypothetical protein